MRGFFTEAFGRIEDPTRRVRDDPARKGPPDAPQGRSRPPRLGQEPEPPLHRHIERPKSPRPVKGLRGVL